MSRRKLKHKGKPATPLYKSVLLIFYCISAVVSVFISFIFFGRYGRPSVYERYKILYKGNTKEVFSAILIEVCVSLVILCVSILLLVLWLFLKRRKYNRIKQKKFPKKDKN